MPKPLFACTFLLLAGAAGCASNNPHCHGGQLVTEHKCDDKPDTTTVPYKATYALYQWRTPPADQPTPHTWIPEQETSEMFVRGLDKGDNIGFEKDDKGQLFAVAGTEKIPLEPGRYCWHITEATEYHGLRRVVHEGCEMIEEMVATIVGVPVSIVVIILLLPVFILLLPFFLLIFLGALML
jgi:hypothetical protein